MSLEQIINLKLTLYNLKYLFFKPRKAFNKKLENHEYQHPNYFEKLLNNFTNVVNKKYLMGTTENFINNKIYVFGELLEPIKFDYDNFNQFKFPKIVKKPAYFDQADLKVPYEIGRLQILQNVNMSNRLFNLSENQKNAIKQIKKSFFNEIENSEPYSIFWNSPMDVAIRLINLIFEKNFIYVDSKNNNTDQLDKLIFKHYQFVINNLENNSEVIGNHYFVELASLILFHANYKSEDINQIKFIKEELEAQLILQFENDGTNFEKSTHYSALILEALILIKFSLIELDIPDETIKNIDKIINVNFSLLKDLNINYELSQIGDNDSGKIFYCLFNEFDPLNIDLLLKFCEMMGVLKNENTRVYSFKKQSIHLPSYYSVSHPKIFGFKENYENFGYFDFGIFIWKNNEDYLSIICGEVGQNLVGGHNHYDQLSIECSINGNWVARDPGTGTYTDNLETRNLYRSLNSHWGPNIDFKIKTDFTNTFKLINMSSGNVLEFNKEYFLGSAKFGHLQVIREVKIEKGTISITDYCKEPEIFAYKNWGEEENGCKIPFSKGYKR